jgi:hypothetical protein
MSDMPEKDTFRVNPALAPELFIDQRTGQVRIPLLVAAAISTSQCLVAFVIFLLLGGPSQQPYFLQDPYDPPNVPTLRNTDSINGGCVGGGGHSTACCITLFVFAATVFSFVWAARNLDLGLSEILQADVIKNERDPIEKE